MMQAKTSKPSIKDPLSVVEFLSALVAAQSRVFLTLSSALGKL